MNNLDKFYTKPEIAQQCVDYLKQLITISSNDILLEPSAGCGNFLKALTNYNVVVSGETSGQAETVKIGIEESHISGDILIKII